VGKAGEPTSMGALSPKQPPTLRLGISDYEKKIPMKGVSSCKVGQKVCAMVIGKVVGIRKDKHGESVEIEMSSATVEKHSGDDDMKDMMDHY